jgi:Uma2 family endonuclease
MTTADAFAKAPRPQSHFRLPDPPPREPDELTNYDHLHKTGNSHHLARHFGNPETTLVEADRWIVPHPGYGSRRRRVPDLLIAFGVDPEMYEANNGYIISEQGKPPDFVMEVASVSTGRIDVGEKRADYTALGIAEYWRFDKTGEYHGARLAGDRLVDGEYQPVAIEELADGALQGYSAVLNLYLRWEQGELGWHDPATGRHIVTFDEERSARIEAEARANAAESRIRELEEQLRERPND